MTDGVDERLEELTSAEPTRQSSSADESENRRYETRFAASCVYCKQSFETASNAREHSESCPQRPVAACRFCHEPHRASDGPNPDDHYYSCQQFRAWHRRRRSRGTGQHGGDLDPFQQRQLILPWFHEFSAYLKYDTSAQRNPFKWYYGLDAARKEYGGDLSTGFTVEYDQLPEATRLVTEYDADNPDTEDVVERWQVDLRYSESGIDLPDDEVAAKINWRLDTVNEFRVYVYPEGYENFSEAKNEGRKRAYYRLRPRWPEQTANDGEASINPVDLIGTDIETKGTNIQFSRYPSLLERALKAIRGSQGQVWNGPTFVDVDAVTPSNLHESSNITDAERYVRVEAESTRQMIAIDGPLHRISLLLADERDGYAKSVRDDRGEAGKYHTATIGEMRAAELIGGHDLAKEFKHYYLRAGRDVQDDRLEHPKVGVSLQHDKQKDTVYWDDLDAMNRELEEGVLNLLQWSDVRLRPTDGPYVADDYFKPVGSSRFRKLIDDPTPEIESQQQNLVERWALMGNINETQLGIMQTLVTDGGQLSPADIAENLGKAVSTIRKNIRSLGDLAQHEYGDVQLGSQYLGQQVVKKLDAADAVVQNELEEAADNLLQAENISAQHGEDSVWDRWRDNWVSDVRSDGDKDEIVLGWEAADRRELREIIRSGALAWAREHGVEHAAYFARHFRVWGELRDGSTVRYADEKLLELLPWKDVYLKTG